MTRLLDLTYLFVMVLPMVLGRPLFQPRDLGYSINLEPEGAQEQAMIHVPVDIRAYEVPRRELTSGRTIFFRFSLTK
ncbi:hypothetical protein IAR55_000787 [Kwoniella newhampshirensis]|uniref:Uncharacterized protein n=1 Tax=Kwoniella newhampshirensis TaxID=1651941 RepID=A0AAW0Z4F3_9TREE